VNPSYRVGDIAKSLYLRSHGHEEAEGLTSAGERECLRRHWPAEEHLIKAQLVYKIDMLMEARGLKQKEAAALFGIRQPDVSKMLRGDFRQFSVERLMRFLVALGQDVEIVVKPHRGSRRPAQLKVA
jgi:predicted XRE-type DNA-binding protein